MQATPFQTSWRLWLWISLVLFAAIWCFVPIDIKSETYRPVVLLWNWIGYIFRSDVHGEEVFGVGIMLLMFGCVSSIVAVVLAWPLQGFIVFMRERKRG